jgi:hypothetical protein
MEGDRRAEADEGTFPGRVRRTPARIELSLLVLAHSVLTKPRQTLHDVRLLCCASPRARFWVAGREFKRDRQSKRAP